MRRIRWNYHYYHCHRQRHCHCCWRSRRRRSLSRRIVLPCCWTWFDSLHVFYPQKQCRKLTRNNRWCIQLSKSPLKYNQTPNYTLSYIMFYLTWLNLYVDLFLKFCILQKKKKKKKEKDSYPFIFNHIHSNQQHESSTRHFSQSVSIVRNKEEEEG